MGIEQAPESGTLHTNVVEGLVKVIRHIGTSGLQDPMTMFQIATTNIADSTARMFIFEFIKDGIPSLQQDTINAVQNGDYSAIWRITNIYLQKFGHAPQEPVEIVLE